MELLEFNSNKDLTKLRMESSSASFSSSSSTSSASEVSKIQLLAVSTDTRSTLRVFATTPWTQGGLKPHTTTTNTYAFDISLLSDSFKKTMCGDYGVLNEAEGKAHRGKEPSQ